MENKLANWQKGKAEELKFWDTWLSSKGGFWKESGYDWTEDFKTRMDPESVLQDYVADEIRKRNITDLTILDVCAGPLTILNKTLDGKRLNITAVDALADEYDEMLNRNNIIPIVRTVKGDVEKYWPDRQFNVIHCSNGLDHSYDPIEGIINMILSLQPNGFIVLKHYIREGERGSYHGLHQWNFYVKETESGHEFCISDAQGKEKSVSQCILESKSLSGFNFECESRIVGNEIINIISEFQGF
jgi:2-polyprenyl-3-methyl-5-hydroxy-6-metoxy-1,4-benzoquinol methylase